MPSKRPQVPQMRGVTDLFNIETEEVQADSTVPLSKILVSKHQPRRYFDPEKLEQLTQSVREHGILEPLLVRPSGSNYELIAGERRYRAAQKVGLKVVPVVIREFDDQQALQVALIENLQRDDLNPVEETEGILHLLAIDLSITTNEVVSVLNQAANAKSRRIELKDNVILQLEKIEFLLSTIGRFNAESFRVNRLPLLNLPKDVLEALRQGKIEFTKARAISRVKDEEQQSTLLKQAISKDLSLNEIKIAIKELTPELEPTREKAIVAQLDEISRRLRKIETWGDRKKQNRIAKLLNELDKLTENSD